MVLRTLAFSFLLSPYLPNVLPHLALLGAGLFILLNISFFVYQFHSRDQQTRHKKFRVYSIREDSHIHSITQPVFPGNFKGSSGSLFSSPPVQPRLNSDSKLRPWPIISDTTRSTTKDADQEEETSGSQGRHKKLTKELIQAFLQIIHTIWYKFLVKDGESLRFPWEAQHMAEHSTNFSKMGSQTQEEALFGAVLGPLLNQKVSTLTESFLDWFLEKKQESIHEKVFVQACRVLVDHIALYKRIRKEIESETVTDKTHGDEQEKQIPIKSSVVASPSSPDPTIMGSNQNIFRHLDDFNESQVETSDAMSNWSLKLDGIHEKVLLRMKAEKLLHGALNSNDQEKDYLRKVVGGILSIIHFRNQKSRSPSSHHPDFNSGNGNVGEDYAQSRPLYTSSTLLGSLSREILVCRVLYPCIQTLSNPLHINDFLAEKAQKRIMIQKSVKTFRSTLDRAFSSFPPTFAFANGAAPTTSIAQWSHHNKQRFFEILSKHTRRVDSVIDIKALMHEVLRELRKKRDESGDATSPDEIDDVDSAKRYLKSLDSLRTRLQRRFAMITEGSQQDMSLNRESEPSLLNLGPSAVLFGTGVSEKASLSRRFSIKDGIALTLEMVLEEYARGQEATGKSSTATSALFYFLDFLEKNHPNEGILKLRFWNAAENYKKLLHRLVTSVIASNIQVSTGLAPFNLHFADTLPPADKFSSQEHTRLRKEVLKIYRTFLVVRESPLLMSPSNDIEIPPSPKTVAMSNYVIELNDPEVKASFERYISPLLVIESQPQEQLAKTDSKSDYTCVFRAQHIIFDQLSRYFRSFLHSESYFRWSSDMQKEKLTLLWDETAKSETSRDANANSTINSERVGGGLSTGIDGVNRFQELGRFIRLDDDSLKYECVNSTLIGSLFQQLDVTAKKIRVTQNVGADSVGTGDEMRRRSQHPSQDSRSSFPLAPGNRVYLTLDEDVLEEFFPEEDETNLHGSLSRPGDDQELRNGGHGEEFISDGDETDPFTTTTPSPDGISAHTTSKLSQIKEDLESLLLQFDCVDLMLWYIRRRGNFPVQLSILEETRVLLRENIGDIVREKTRLESMEQREAIMPGQCTVSIISTVDDTVSSSWDETKEAAAILSSAFAPHPTTHVHAGGISGKKIVTFYLIQVERTDQGTGWIVRRRYNDFHLLHKKLRDKFPIVNEFDLPGKGIGLWQAGKQGLKLERMQALERYLQRLIDTPEICQTDQVRDFLSSNYKSVISNRLFPNIISNDPERNEARLQKLQSFARNLTSGFGNANLSQRQQPEKSLSENSAGPKFENPLGSLKKKLLEKSKWKRSPFGTIGGSARVDTGAENLGKLTINVQALDLAPSQSHLLENPVVSSPIGFPSAVRRSSSMQLPPDAYYSDGDINDEDVDFDVDISPYQHSTQISSSESLNSSQRSRHSFDGPRRSGAESNQQSISDVSYIPLERSSLVEPLCQLLLEAYEFPEQKSWLQMNTATRLLKTLFNLPQHKSLHEYVESWVSFFVADETLLALCGWIKAFTFLIFNFLNMGEKKPGQPLSLQERISRRVDVRQKVLHAWPDVFSRMLGPTKAARDSLMVFEMVQNETLNKHLLYNLLDAIVSLLLEEDR